eukprot:3481352-Rhodomonas_salina.2
MLPLSARPCLLLLLAHDRCPAVTPSELSSCCRASHRRATSTAQPRLAPLGVLQASTGLKLA